MKTSKEVVRHLNPLILTEYCKMKGISFKAEKEEKPDDMAERFLKHLKTVSPNLADQVELDFQDIQDLSSGNGTLLLIQNDKEFFGKIPQTLRQEMGYYDNALWTLIKDEALFERTATEYAIEHTSGWTTYLLPPSKFDISKKNIDKLGEEVGGYFRREEQRGENCTAEYFKKEDYHCFVIYIEDYLNREVRYDEKKKLNKRDSRRSVFEIYVIYFPTLNRISIKTKRFRAPKKRLIVAKIFSQVIFNQELSDMSRLHYNLDALHKKIAEQSYQLSFNPDDGIKDARVKTMRIKLLGEKNASITYTISGTKNGLDDIAKLVNVEYHPDQYQILAAEISVTFKPEVKRRPGAVTAYISGNSCSLGIKKFERIVSKYLIEWGLDPIK